MEVNEDGWMRREYGVDISGKINSDKKERPLKQKQKNE